METKAILESPALSLEDALKEAEQLMRSIKTQVSKCVDYSL